MWERKRLDFFPELKTNKMNIKLNRLKYFIVLIGGILYSKFKTLMMNMFYEKCLGNTYCFFFKFVTYSFFLFFFTFFVMNFINILWRSCNHNVCFTHTLNETKIQIAGDLLFSIWKSSRLKCKLSDLSEIFRWNKSSTCFLYGEYSSVVGIDDD